MSALTRSHGRAALLIDLENFYIGREDIHERTHPDEDYEFPIDLDSLCAFARDIAGDRRLMVQRAYANFNDRRPGDGEKRWEYYLQPQPRFLMEQGIEPVQVFRFPGGNNKNAADMKMAMDATALLSGPAAVDLFIIVTGDSDFIPLVLELKRLGAEVVVIGVTGCTKPIFERYCDRFEYFEDLLAARELQREGSTELDVVRTALRALVEKRSPIKFAAVKPLLSAPLGGRFDPTRFGCESTGDFLRKHADYLGVVVRRGEHDWEIAGRGAEAGNGAVQAAETTPAAAEPPAADVPESAAAPDGETSTRGDGAVAEAPPEETAAEVPAASRAEDGHSSEVYRDLLRQGVPRCYVVAYDDWNLIVDNVFAIVGGPPDAEGDGDGTVTADARPKVVHQELLTEVTDLCTEQGMTDAGRKVRDVCFQLFKAGTFHCAEDGAEPAQTDFHWSRAAILDPAIDHVDALVERAWSYLAGLLRRRLEQRGLGELVKPQPFLGLVAGSDPHDEDVEMVERILAGVNSDAS